MLVHMFLHRRRHIPLILKVDLGRHLSRLAGLPPHQHLFELRFSGQELAASVARRLELGVPVAALGRHVVIRVENRGLTIGKELPFKFLTFLDGLGELVAPFLLVFLVEGRGLAATADGLRVNRLSQRVDKGQVA